MSKNTVVEVSEPNNHLDSLNIDELKVDKLVCRSIVVECPNSSGNVAIVANESGTGVWVTPKGKNGYLGLVAQPGTRPYICFGSKADGAPEQCLYLDDDGDLIVQISKGKDVEFVKLKDLVKKED